MKRIFIISLLLVIILCGCDKREYRDFSEDLPEDYIIESGETEDTGEIKGIWVAIYEAAPESSDKNKYIEKTNEMMKNISEFGFTDVFFQVRANCDSVYNSSLFAPCYMYATGDELWFDALQIMSDSAHKYNLKIHAWINPYRVCGNRKNMPLRLPEGIAESDIYQNGEAFYLNPGDEKTTQLVLKGIKEIIENYNVDGIHIDDYFYPCVDEKIDKDEYKKYKSDGGENSLYDFRRDCVSAFVSSAYAMIKSEDSRLMFSISPSADIDKNYNVLFADVEKWCSESGYCDMIIPQIYFGFENSSLPFEKTYAKWSEITSEKDIKLCVGLAIYKSGCEDKYAGDGKNEWINNNDIIKSEVLFLREHQSDGFAVFSYNYIFGNRKFTKEEVENLKSVI